MSSKRAAFLLGSSSRNSSRPRKVSRPLQKTVAPLQKTVVLLPSSIDDNDNLSSDNSEDLSVDLDRTQLTQDRAENVQNSDVSQDNLSASSSRRFSKTQKQDVSEFDQDKEDSSSDSEFDFSAVQDPPSLESDKNDSSSASSSILRSVLASQKKVLEERGRLLSNCSPADSRQKNRNKDRRRLETLERASAAKTPEERWNVYLDLLQPNFFTSAEALLKETTRVRKGKVAYKGLLVNEKNCEDVARMFKLGWETKKSLGQSLETFNQFRIAIGQFCRVCVAMKIVSPQDICKKGSVFRLLCNLDAVTAFIGYFQIRSAAATVMGKAIHLTRLGRYATAFMKNENLLKENGQVETVCSYLRSVSSSHKNEVRKQSYSRKSLDSRALSGKMLLPSDIRHLTSLAEDNCKSMMENVKACFSDGDREHLKKYVLARKRFLDKWSLNFLCLLMLRGGGQRPQVFGVLEAPNELELRDLDAQCREKKCFQLRLSNEKRFRCATLPHLLLPASVFRVLEFHVSYILPIIHDKLNVPEGDGRRKYLLLNTRTKGMLTSHNVTGSLRAHIKTYDPELAAASTMTLRASYATFMLQRHRKGKLLKHLSEDDFIGYLAKLMNTSEEQLKQTYIACDSQDFVTCADLVAHIIDDEVSDDESE